MLLNCGVGEDSWESLGLQGDPTSHSEGDQPWDFFGRNDAKAATPVLWPPRAKSWLIGKDSDAGRDWGQEEKGTTEDEMAGWHHWLDGQESEWTLGVGDGQGGLACCNSWGRKESDTTERLIWSDLIWSLSPWLADGCLLAVSSYDPLLVCMCIFCVLIFPSYRTPVILELESTAMISFYFNYLYKVSIFKYRFEVLGINTLIYEFGEELIQSIITTLSNAFYCFRSSDRTPQNRPV